jgi:hypothetical protein
MFRATTNTKSYKQTTVIANNNDQNQITDLLSLYLTKKKTKEETIVLLTNLENRIKKT